jgi:Glycosyl transferase family 2
MSATPRISVIVCAYNYERFLPEALDSVLAQDHPSFEVIVVDDGSTDGTPAVVAGYGDALRSIRRENGGLNAATSTGIEAARGEYLTFIDADDAWPRDRLTNLGAVLDARPEAGLAWGDMEVIDAEGRVTAPSCVPFLRPGPRSGRLLGPLLRGNYISAGSLMVRASLRDRFHPIAAVAPYQDWWIATRVAACAEIAAIGAVVNRYRQHGENMNLGAREASRLRLLATEVPFRRELLTATELGAVAPADLLAALQELDAIAAQLLPHAELGSDLPAADEPARLAAMHAASDALDEADLDAAAAWLVRAAAHDLLDPSPRLLLAELAPLLSAPVAA